MTLIDTCLEVAEKQEDTRDEDQFSFYVLDVCREASRESKRKSREREKSRCRLIVSVTGLSALCFLVFVGTNLGRFTSFFHRSSCMILCLCV